MDGRSHWWRHSIEDNQLHLYRVTDLGDPQVAVLVPFCEEDQLHPRRHDRDELRLQVPLRQYLTGGVCSLCLTDMRVAPKLERA